jgi:N,N'-diacetyllegionaminate synthase
MKLIAEIGVNWDGDFELVKEMMQESLNAKFDFVKFQAFKPELVAKHPEASRAYRSSITPENINKINSIANDIGIEWFCTPMYEDAIKILEPFVNRYKIREYDGREIIVNRTTNMFKKLLNTKKEIIISSESSPIECKFYKNKQIKWIYCVPKYPCNLEEINFLMIENFDGFSNHCPNIAAPMKVIDLKSEILEVHITSNKRDNFIDNNVSFDYSDMKEISKYAKSKKVIP